MFNIDVECITPYHISLAGIVSRDLNLPVRNSGECSLPLCPLSLLIPKNWLANSNIWEGPLGFYLNAICCFGLFKELFIIQPIGFLMAKIARTWCTDTLFLCLPVSLSLSLSLINNSRVDLDVLIIDPHNKHNFMLLCVLYFHELSQLIFTKLWDSH